MGLTSMKAMENMDKRLQVRSDQQKKDEGQYQPSVKTLPETLDSYVAPQRSDKAE